MIAGCGTGGTSVDKACTDLATARCNKRQSCSNGARITRDYGDMATCLTREKLGCVNALAAPSTGNSPDREETCAAAYPAQDCADFFIGNPPAVCVNTGLLANGASCSFNGQCMSSYCVGDKNAQCGTCGDEPAQGASCSNDFCARGQFCDANTTTCVTGGTAGSACNRTAPCNPGFLCVGATMAMMGTCQAAATTAGATCDPLQRTAPGCDANLGLSCNTMTKTCSAISYVGDGQPCGVLASGAAAGCAGGGQCIIATGSTMGTCKAPAADGAACDTALGPPCLAPSRCVLSGAGTAGTCEQIVASKC
ncbi:MAG TPA: hypothetical protein VFF06_17790 [Polyangia bacterium]|nr:hypothetical protein [Polyangia bacterium]